MSTLLNLKERYLIITVIYFTDNKNVTISQNNQINTYKKYTNGSYYGFDPNNFTNMLNIDKMTISATQDNGKFNHNLLLDFLIIKVIIKWLKFLICMTMN